MTIELTLIDDASYCNLPSLTFEAAVKNVVRSFAIFSVGDVPNFVIWKVIILIQ